MVSGPSVSTTPPHVVWGSSEDVPLLLSYMNEKVKGERDLFDERECVCEGEGCLLRWPNKEMGKSQI